MGRTTELRREIKRRFFPAMTAKGFSTDMRYAPFFVGCRRMTPQGIHVCDIQWDKYGRPRFVINFGKCSLAGVICHGQPVRPEDVTASETPLRGRLAPGRHSTVGGWFRQDRPLIESPPPIASPSAGGADHDTPHPVSRSRGLVAGRLGRPARARRRNALFA